MNQIDIQYYKTKIGELILGSFDNKLCLLDFRYRRMRSTVDKRIKKELNAEYLEQDNNILKETRKQIDEYLIGERIEFAIPILMVGSDFQKQVWNALINVKYGEIASYLDLAKNIDKDPHPLFAMDNTLMFFNDAKKAFTEMITAVKES